MISGFMIDLDGTIYKGGRLIDGAEEFIRTLKQKDIPFVFLTNNSSHSRSHYLEKLRSLGLDVGMENILSSTTATIRYLKERFPGRKVFPLGTEEFVRELEDEGIAISEKEPDIVLLAFDRTITYGKINKAYRFLMDGALFVATHPDDLCPTEDGYDVDIGPFIRFFEQMTGTEATVIGKPNPSMVEMAALAMGLDPDGLAMVGDRLYTDMRMAADSGITSILVLSGEARAEDLEGSGIDPTFIVRDVGGIADILKDR